MQYLETLSPMSLTVLCTLFTWGVTAAGAAVVFFFKTVKPCIMNMMLGFGSGVMIAACFWSLLAPAIEMEAETSGAPWLVPCLALALGGGFILLADRLLDRVTPGGEGNGRTTLKRSILLVTAVTLHNIPEGMVIGVAFGSAALGIPGASLWSGIVLAIGIGLQNFPEGAAVSLPLRRDGLSRRKSFAYGQMSGIVEPVAAVIGLAAVGVMQSMVPFLLAFSAGAMLAVVVGELIPESVTVNKSITIVGFLLGFMLMMALDVALG